MSAGSPDGPRRPAGVTTRRVATPWVVVTAAVVDAVWIVWFAATGRRSHDESSGLVGVLGTAWPFLVGAAVGWVCARAWRRPLDPWPTGVVVWVATWSVGMLLRLLAGQGIRPSFQLVAALVLGVGLVGWRAVVALARRRTSRSRVG